MNRLRRWSMLLILACAVAAGGCNTVKGMGKDLQRAGQKIEDAAKK
jgi:predicted small secreted protein